ncbi:hypothetical protein B0I35DRAFT_439569 [Stachybotrys elegans]|uniref:TIL domain-containing protein n=1 Tax=Stachybotrys elegans TaxID=80388 RepID=A0A8K0SKF5_9HYPO|nr:hypothetical protein B0I35DRAFT_439569 [Stachybotrys elegans]
MKFIVGLLLSSVSAVMANPVPQPETTPAAVPVQRCVPNAVWLECGTACPPTCAEPNPENCTTQCVVGCQCVEGFVLNEVGLCVTLDQC